MNKAANISVHQTGVPLRFTPAGDFVVIFIGDQMWLLERLFGLGDQPTPRFAFQGTVNWIRGLAILCFENEFSHDALRSVYQHVQRRPANESADTLAFECLTMSMHNASALDSMNSIENPYPIVRSAIIAWYYAIYYASKAMLAASSGADPQTHSSVGRIWQSEIINNHLVKPPFIFSIINLTPANIRDALNLLRRNNMHDLNTRPENVEMAYGAICSYLKGTAEYEKERIEEQVKGSAEFRNNGFTSFRSNAAKVLRDARLTPAHVNFLVQAFRYRGKANYRDAIYLSYGGNRTEQLSKLIEDLGSVGGAFSLMAAHYISRRTIRGNWRSFAEDINAYAQFDLPYDPREI